MHKAIENLIILAEVSEKEEFIELLQNIGKHNDISTMDDLAEVLDESRRPPKRLGCFFI